MTGTFFHLPRIFFAISSLRLLLFFSFVQSTASIRGLPPLLWMTYFRYPASSPHRKNTFLRNRLLGASASGAGECFCMRVDALIRRPTGSAITVCLFPPSARNSSRIKAIELEAHPVATRCIISTSKSRRFPSHRHITTTDPAGFSPRDHAWHIILRHGVSRAIDTIPPPIPRVSSSRPPPPLLLQATGCLPPSLLHLHIILRARPPPPVQATAHPSLLHLHFILRAPRPLRQRTATPPPSRPRDARTTAGTRASVGPSSGCPGPRRPPPRAAPGLSPRSAAASPRGSLPVRRGWISLRTG